ncbi:MAG: exonuclease SbcCD subunit D C-terminal domain-containing protein [Bacteroidota bacterium]
MKILHTADWHIGQLFHEYDRTYEHKQFLNWLVGTIQDEEVDVLLISGDVFDLSNPSAASVKMFYTFLNQAVRSNPELQIIVIAGNHDSAARLESPKPLLESSNIHIIGLVEKDREGNINYDKLTIPLKDKDGNVQAWCMAIPFLRMGDYPVISECENPYTEGVAAFYNSAYEFALKKRQNGHAVIAMGHLHAQQAEITEMDKTERLIMGGVECISATAFNSDIKYVGLGHIHKAQRIGGKEHIRYSGSPIPMSFSERNYRHQVVVFEIENGEVKEIRTIEIPVAIPVQSIPEVHSTMADVLDALAQLPNISGSLEFAPYLEVRVLLDRPEPALRYKIETAITGKHIRLATINVKYPVNHVDSQMQSIAQDRLDELQPLDIFSRIYESTYSNPVPTEILQLFNQITQEVSQIEEQ